MFYVYIIKSMKNNQLYPHTFIMPSSFNERISKKFEIFPAESGVPREGVRIYIGSTNNLRRRLAEHNSSFSSYTKKYMPYEVVYYEAYRSEEDARKRESNLKLRANPLSQLKRRIVASLKSPHLSGKREDQS